MPPLLLRNVLGYFLSRAKILAVVNGVRRMLGLPQMSWFGVFYRRWVKEHTPGPAELQSMRAEGEAMTDGPLISVLTPVYDVDERWLRACIASVRNQAYPRWELCLVDDASPSPHVARVLEEEAKQDARVRFQRRQRNGGIATASNDALAMARGEYVALLDHDDELAPEALLEVARRVIADPGLDLVYSDEDKLDSAGRRIGAFFKPDWSPELLRSMNYVCHLGVYRRRILEELGGFRPGFDGSQDYDLVLRFTERTNRIAHVPAVLYRWRQIPGSVAGSGQAKPYAYEAGRRALEESVARCGEKAEVIQLKPGRYRVRYAIEGDPLVSVIIPTKDHPRLLAACLDSLDHTCAGRSLEILVVDNGSSSPKALRQLEEVARRHRVIRDPSPFNWAALNNRAAHQARGDYLLFLNDDVEALEPGWLDAMLEQAQRPDVGAVGAKLLFPGGTIQHAGVVLGLGGAAGHLFTGSPGHRPGYFDLANVVREVSAVTGACMLVSRRLFEEVGGFDEKLGVAYNDTDFCIRLLQLGRRNLFTAHATLMHRESATRGNLHPAEDEREMRRKWGHLLAADPWYNRNLSLRHADPVPTYDS
jgi:glycosyltransferase involved in cell wall biosynthesis